MSCCICGGNGGNTLYGQRRVALNAAAEAFGYAAFKYPNSVGYAIVHDKCFKQLTAYADIRRNSAGAE